MARRGGFPGGGMPGNMSNLMKQAQRMQRQMEESAKELESAEFTAAAGGGAVEVTVTGKKEVTKVKLDPEAVDPDDVEMLEDLIMAATNEALRKAEEASAANMAKLTAQRLAFHIIDMPQERVEKLAETMVSARKTIRYCKECLTLTDQELCPICANPNRNHKVIMVVENPRDMSAYEKTGKYEGVYHVLHGAISPMLGIGPSDIRLKELMHRLEKDVDEVIIATNSSLEGETTAMYISKLVKPTGIKVSRIASGVPVGGDLEYIDEVTLLRALEGRVEL